MEEDRVFSFVWSTRENVIVFSSTVKLDLRYITIYCLKFPSALITLYKAKGFGLIDFLFPLGMIFPNETYLYYYQYLPIILCFNL
jgi:hypothetical protein